jgi:hypothetical protein
MPRLATIGEDRLNKWQGRFFRAVDNSPAHLLGGESAQEQDLEQALVQHMRDFLLELGVGFAFVGSQYRLDVGGEEFYIDLLFYHLRLRCSRRSKIGAW